MTNTNPRSRIMGLGGYVPQNVITNADLEKMMDTTDEWIVERTGIRERRWTLGQESGAEMSAKASRQAIEAAGIDPSDIDMIVYATLSPDVTFPGTGCFLQKELGLKEIPCLDIRQQCSGFIYGMSIADNFIRSGMYETILVVGAEIHSTGLDKTTRGRDVAVLFGDGAGAAVVGVSTDPSQQVLSTHIHADGSEAEILWLISPASKNEPWVTIEDLEEGLHFPRMQGRRVFKHAVTRMPQAIMEGLHKNGLTLDDIDMVIPHQANLRINQYVGKMIGLPPEKMHNNIEKLGNTTAATIPLCMLDAVNLGKIKKGDLVCLVAFGAGLTWGSVFLRY